MVPFETQNLDFIQNAIQATTAAKKTKTSKNSKNSDPKTKSCNCSKTLCLKLYCDCFARGELCTSLCNCKSCKNTTLYEFERKNAIKACLERNPDAFKPKNKDEKSKIIYDLENGQPLFLVDEHNQPKGCSCKRSSCLKNYCECFRAGVFCVSGLCVCRECRNDDEEKRSLEELKKLASFQKAENFIQEQRTPEKINETETKTTLITPIGLPKLDPTLLKTSPQKFNSPKISKEYQSTLKNLNSELDLHKNQKISNLPGEAGARRHII